MDLFVTVVFTDVKPELCQQCEHRLCTTSLCRMCHIQEYSHILNMSAFFTSLFKKPLFQSLFVIGIIPSPTHVNGSFPRR